MGHYEKALVWEPLYGRDNKKDTISSQITHNTQIDHNTFWSISSLLGELGQSLRCFWQWCCIGHPKTPEPPAQPAHGCCLIHRSGNWQKRDKSSFLFVFTQYYSPSLVCQFLIRNDHSQWVISTWFPSECGFIIHGSLWKGTRLGTIVRTRQQKRHNFITNHS